MSRVPILGVFLLAIHSHLYSFALRFLFLPTRSTSYIFLKTLATSFVFLECTIKEKGRKRDRKPYPLQYGLRNPYRNPKSENGLKIVPRNLKEISCTFMNLASGCYREDGSENDSAVTMTNWFRIFHLDNYRDRMTKRCNSLGGCKQKHWRLAQNKEST